jgi:hypothetical protein
MRLFFCAQLGHSLAIFSFFRGQRPVAVTLLLLLLAWQPAQAVDFAFPGNLPLGCTGASGAYACILPITLALGDNITIAAQATTITVFGGFTTLGSNNINTAGSAANLTFAIVGAAAALTLGADSNLNGSVVSAGAVTLGAGATVGSDIATSLIGLVSLGASSRVLGKISTVTGYVQLGALAYVGGNISTDIGYVGLGANSTVNGNINTVIGFVVVGAESKVNGTITTLFDGYVTLGALSNVTGSIIVSGAGYVSTGDTTVVGGGITTVSGAITIGALGKVGGSVAVTASGAVTLGALADVTGNVSTEYGATTVGAGAKVSGMISMNVAGAIGIGAGANVYAVCCFRHDASCVVDGSGLASPLVCVAPGNPQAAGFDCLETGTNASWSATARKALYTKLVGADFAFDIAALATDGSLKSDYAATTRYVKVALFQDSATPSSCSQFASQSPVASQTVAFSSGAVSGAAGRTLSGTFNLGSAYKLLRCRVTECTDSTCGSATALAPSCSSDQFAVRPSAVTLVTTATATAPLATSTPVVKAGVAFTLRATTSAGNSYAGNLTRDAGKLTAQTPAQDTSIQSGGATGALNPVTLIANATAINATYDEAGYVYLAPGAYRDDTFAAVDSAMGDCHTTTANDLYLADTLVGGKYGCSIGNTSTVSLGRFIPDHFVVTAASVANRSQLASVAACSASPFGYMSEPMRVRFTLNATNLLGGLTTNYQGVFAKLATTDWLATGNNSIGVRMTAKGFKSTPTSVDSCGVAFDPLTPFATTFACTNGVTKASVLPSTGARVSVVGTPAAPLWSGGSSAMAATLLFKRADVADGPYALSIGIAPQDSEGVIAAYDLDTNNDNGNDHVALGTTQARHGRLSISNNYGSDLLRLSVPIQAQYWNGSAYVINADDSCTPITASSFSVTQGRGAPITTAILVGAALTAGSSNKTFVLARPINAISGIGSVMVRTSATAPVDTPLNTYLPGVGTETFGLYKGGVVIFGRELY